LLQRISQRFSSGLSQTIEDGENQTTSQNGSFLMYWTMCNAQKRVIPPIRKKSFVDAEIGSCNLQTM
jgi:hypothetical protein